MTQRHFGIDVLKVLCAQLIVLHHGMLYAPEQFNFMAHWPGLSAFLSEPGRWVVHVFLVMGGYLSAMALQRVGNQNLTVLAWRRYLRLMPMFVFSLCVTVLVAWWVRHDYAPDFISPMPTWQVWFAHLTLSFDWMDLGAISAGAWYVAIDFQLYVLLAAWMLWSQGSALASRPWIKPAVVTAATVLSMTVISKFPQLDIWAPYFISSYGLGCLVAWVNQQTISRRWVWFVLGALLFDLAFEWRGRQAFAMLAAVGLLVWPMWSRKPASPAWLARASDLSYPLFVGHFSLLILLGSWWTHHAWPQGPVSALAYLALTTALTWGWALSLQGALNALVTFWTRHFLARTRWA